MAKGKRVSNKPQGAPGSRQFHHYTVGFHRQRKLDRYAELRANASKELLEGNKDKKDKHELKQTIKHLGQEIRALLPKALVRRHQAR